MNSRLKKEKNLTKITTFLRECALVTKKSQILWANKKLPELISAPMLPRLVLLIKCFVICNTISRSKIYIIIDSFYTLYLSIKPSLVVCLQTKRHQRRVKRDEKERCAFTIAAEREKPMGLYGGYHFNLVYLQNHRTSNTKAFHYARGKYGIYILKTKIYPQNI